MSVAPFGSLWGILTLVALLFVIVFLRYVLVSGGLHISFHILFRNLLRRRILNPVMPSGKQIRNEILWSAASGFIFTLFGILIYWLWLKGYTAVYADAKQYSYLYLPSSVFAVLFLQDTYYYWIHRWMHIPRIYKIIHKIHHKSIHTSAWTSFSFHPLETILQAIVLVPIIVFVPLHPYAILAILIFMTISATINHAGVEVYPLGKYGKWFGRYVIGATHHDVHHRKFLCNYGLYFTFWDRWMGTQGNHELQKQK